VEGGAVVATRRRIRLGRRFAVSVAIVAIAAGASGISRPTAVAGPSLEMPEAGAATPPGASPRIVDVSAAAGVADTTLTWSAEAGDINGDGSDDLLVGNHYIKPSYLYANENDGTFARIAQSEFRRRDRHDCSFGDANGDGLQDIYCSIGGCKGTCLSANELWIQGPSGQFTDEAEAYGVADRRGRGRDNTFIDVNRDGYEDLYVGNDFPRQDGLVSRNKLFINDGGDHFHSAPTYHLNEVVGGKVVQAVDYDADGWTDLLVCGDRHLFLYRNVGGVEFEDVSRLAGVALHCESVVMAKLNQDELPDLAVVTWSSLRVLLQRSDHTFTPPSVAHLLQGGTAVAAGRVNADSLDDLYIVEAGQPDHDRPDLLLLETDGVRVQSIQIPQTSLGRGDFVTSLDYDGNGRADFLVMNGNHEVAGPVRLLATLP
jgi:hypothetical protein